MFRKISIMIICSIAFATTVLLVWNGSNAKAVHAVASTTNSDEPEHEASFHTDWMILESLARIITDVTNR